MINGKLKQQYITIGYYPTRQDAMIALAEYNKEPYDIEKDKITFATVYDKWSEKKFEKLSASGIKNLRVAYDKCTSLYKMPFKDVKFSHLQAVVDEYQGTSSALAIKKLYSQLYEYAIKNEIVISNLSKQIEIDKYEKKTKTPYTNDEIKTLFNNIDVPFVDTVIFFIYTGLRANEGLDLLVEDVHLKERYLFINKSKTSNGIRYVPINKKIIPIIEKYLKGKTPTDYLITYNGNYIPYPSYFRYFRDLHKALNMPHNIHECRHTLATLLSNANANSTSVKRILGHSANDITEDVYTHKSIDELIKAIDLI